MKLLIIEDEPQMAEEIQGLVKKYNREIEATYCSNPFEGMKAFDTQSFDAALLDIQMPEMTGLEFADYLTAKKPEISIAFITAYNNYASEAFEVNAVDYVLKPIREERFYKTMDKIFREWEDKNIPKTDSPAVVKIQALGKLTVTSGDTYVKWKRHKSSEIFAFLLHNKSAAVHKETLCELIWPDYDPQKALNYLQTMMYQLRKNLAEVAGKTIAIEFSDHCYRLRINGAEYDVNTFLDACQRAFSNPIPIQADLTEAELSYGGCYYGEEGWIWAMGMQQNLALKYQKVLETLIELKMKQKSKEETFFYINKWMANGFHGNEERYISWIKLNIGANQASAAEDLLFY